MLYWRFSRNDKEKNVDTVNTGLALPLAAMMTLTLMVWIYMFVQRVSYMSANKVDAEELVTPADTQRLISAEASSAANNFKNLFEMPVIFYAVSLYLTVFGLVDSLHVTCAWIFVGLRVVHSAIHCSYNRVMHRFAVYLLASLAVWVMVVRGLIAAL